MQADAFALLKCLLRRTRLHSVCFMSVISQLVLSALPAKRSAGCDVRTVAALEAAGECMVQVSKTSPPCATPFPYSLAHGFLDLVLERGRALHLCVCR